MNPLMTPTSGPAETENAYTPTRYKQKKDVEEVFD